MPRSLPARRLVGVDAARGIALLGMVAVHVFGREDDGWGRGWHDVAAGRSAALFALLAGVSLALAFRSPGVRDRLALALRAVLIGALGLALGELESGVAVILAYYGVLFLLVLPWLSAGRRVLATSALLVAVVVPLLSLLLRDELPERDVASPTFDDLAEPLELASELLVTGYYPAAAWVAYLLAGLAVGRLALARPGIALRLAVAGALLAVAASALSALLLGPLGGYDELAEVTRLPPGVGIEEVADEGRFGNVPTTSAWWLAVDAPHSSTPLDLAHTAGTALLVLGLALLVAVRLPELLAPLAAAGSMPLTLYSAHVLLLAETDTDDPVRYYLAQVVVGVLVAMAWRHWVGRGPLEWLVGAVTRPVRSP